MAADHLANMDERGQPTAPIAALDLAALLKGVPAGAWVAISSSKDRMVSYGADMRDVLREAHDKGENDPLILKVPEQQEALLL